MSTEQSFLTLPRVKRRDVRSGRAASARETPKPPYPLGSRSRVAKQGGEIGVQCKQRGKDAFLTLWVSALSENG